MVLDRTSKLNSDYSIFNDEAKTIRVTNKDIDFEKPIAIQIADVLFKQNINSIIIEGGSQTLQTFIDENLWDEARVFTGSTSFKTGIKAPELIGNLISESQIKNDLLKIYAKD